MIFARSSVEEKKPRIALKEHPDKIHHMLFCAKGPIDIDRLTGAEQHADLPGR